MAHTKGRAASGTDSRTPKSFWQVGDTPTTVIYYSALDRSEFRMRRALCSVPRAVEHEGSARLGSAGTAACVLALSIALLTTFRNKVPLGAMCDRAEREFRSFENGKADIPAITRLG